MFTISQTVWGLEEEKKCRNVIKEDSEMTKSWYFERSD